MVGKYAMKMRVTSYDVGPNRTLKPSAILKIMQEVAGVHLEQDGFSYEVMRSQGIVFLLVKLAVSVKKLPHCDEFILAETWFAHTEGAKFIRNMRFLSESGEILLEAVTQWIIADPETHRVLRPSALPFKMPEFSSVGVDAAITRIVLPEKMEDAGARIVRWSDIDCNKHMNNAVYADIICDFFPKGMGKQELRAFQIDFEGEASLGDTIDIKTAADTQGGAIITGTVGGRKCFTSHAGCAGGNTRGSFA